ncbi:Pentatricopeptide repeat-containing protein, mitochondrial [Glycine soja]|uniref:Pentatricopeptide repeat-containing protein, mitochondrial n=1 Tax=Glycine soja TaxID=3848 RepID=A0A445J559_GLYSO|nr:Pentatricopeptide repeat-containing protein, mitochondrial [Glycine soja]
MLMQLRAFKLSFKVIHKHKPTLTTLWHPFASTALAHSNTPFTPSSSFSTFDVLQTISTTPPPTPSPSSHTSATPVSLTPSTPTYCKSHNLLRALALHDKMILRGVKTNCVVVSYILHYLGEMGLTLELGKVEDAVEMVEKMKMKLLDFLESQGVKPNSTTHKMIIECLCSGGKVLEAEAYFNSLEDTNIEIYSAMVNGFCEADLVKTSYEVFLKLSNQGDMAKEASCFKLLNKLCMTVLAALCQAGDMKNARTLFDVFVNRGFTPDVVTYTIMINSYRRMNCLQETHDLFQDMKRKGINPDVITFTVLLDGSLKAYLHKRFSPHGKGKTTSLYVSTILRDMEQMEINPDVVCYTVLIDGLMKTDNFQQAVSLFDKMIESGLEPDTVTYIALVSGLCNRGHMEKAVTLLNEMSSKGMIPDATHQCRNQKKKKNKKMNMLRIGHYDNGIFLIWDLRPKQNRNCFSMESESIKTTSNETCRELKTEKCITNG